MHKWLVAARSAAAFVLGSAILAPGIALAEDAPAPDVDTRLKVLEAYINNVAPPGDPIVGPGHNTWLMVCAALVLFMTLPGLALFYGGLVRSKNILSVMAQCLGLSGVVTLLWWAFGYSVAFSSGSPFFGDFSMALFEGVDAAPNSNYAAWVSENVFAMFQLMFAIITPGLIVGAIAERAKFGTLMVFLTLWMVVIYFPLAHMVWGVDGFMNGVWNKDASIQAIDFAGGTVVHMSSGWSALVLCLLIGKRKGLGASHMPPHSLVLTMVGTGMLWVGWYGFNAGSACGSDGVASAAFTTTTLCAAIGGLSWAAIEWLTRGKPTVLGMCSGIVGGLVVITPAAGFVSASSAVILGVVAGVVPFYACTKLKNALGYDDALDTFGVHGVGGTLGAILTGVFADYDVNGNLKGNLESVIDDGALVIEQLKAVGFTMVYSVVGTIVLYYVARAVGQGWRPTPEDEEVGLDLTDHGERGYSL
jgi:ammonium transporter, Amt family